MTVRVVSLLVGFVGSSGCYLFHGTEDGAPDSAAPEVTDAGARDDRSRPPDGSCTASTRWRLVCEPPVEIATGRAHEPSFGPVEILDVAVAPDRITLLLGGARQAPLAFATLTLEDSRLRVSGTWWDSTWEGAQAAWLVRPVAADDVALAIRTDDEARQEFRLLRARHVPGEVAEPTVEELLAVPGWCGLGCRAAIGSLEGGAAWMATPDREALAVSRFDGSVGLTTTSIAAPAPFAHDGIIVSGASHDGRMLLTGSGSSTATTDAFGVLLDGTRQIHVDVPGDALDPPAVVAVDRGASRFAIFRHVTNSEDTFDRAIAAWVVGPDGELAPWAQVPTEGGASPLRLFVSSDSDRGPAVAWSERVPGSLTDIRVGVLPALPPLDGDACHTLTTSPTIELPRGTRHPSVAAVHAGDDTILFHFEDRAADFSGDTMLTAQRISCSVVEE